jgi:hypothetical protein
MTIEIFVPTNFQSKTLARIEQANAIIAEYRDRGFTLTVRQLFYQLVSRALIENTPAEYKRTVEVVSSARLAGLISWDAIEDRTRHLREVSTWSEPSDIIDSAAQAYREDIWAGQSYRPEVWIEKDALLGVIEGVCREYRVPYFACRGNNSQSEQYKAGRRFAFYLDQGKRPIVLHLGDHDPNGLDMTRDNRDRLAMFARQAVEVRRLALNFAQIEQYSPPPNFAKESDSRYASYVDQYGDNCWELDALDPDVIAALVRDAIDELIERDAWDRAMAEEQWSRDTLAKVSANWAIS